MFIAQLIGVSFHCGTPFQDADAVARAIPVAKRAFEVLASAGYEPYLLDIGGGFPGNEPHMTSIFPTLEAVCLTFACYLTFIRLFC